MMRQYAVGVLPQSIVSHAGDMGCAVCPAHTRRMTLARLVCDLQAGIPW